jgi:hypothetical protein
VRLQEVWRDRRDLLATGLHRLEQASTFLVPPHFYFIASVNISMLGEQGCHGKEVNAKHKNVNQLKEGLVKLGWVKGSPPSLLPVPLLNL